MQRITINQLRQLSPQEQTKFLAWANDLLFTIHNRNRKKIMAERQKIELESEEQNAECR